MYQFFQSYIKNIEGKEYATCEGLIFTKEKNGSSAAAIMIAVKDNNTFTVFSEREGMKTSTKSYHYSEVISFEHLVEQMGLLRKHSRILINFHDDQQTTIASTWHSWAGDSFSKVFTILDDELYGQTRSMFIEPPSDNETLKRLQNADVLFKKKLYSDSANEYQKILDADVLNLPAHLGLIRCQIGLGNISAATQISDKILVLYPNQEIAIRHRISSYFAGQNNHKEALKYFKPVYQKFPNPHNFYLYASHMMACDDGAAIGLLKEQISTYPKAFIKMKDNGKANAEQEADLVKAVKASLLARKENEWVEFIRKEGNSKSHDEAVDNWYACFEETALNADNYPDLLVIYQGYKTRFQELEETVIDIKKSQNKAAIHEVEVLENRLKIYQSHFRPDDGFIDVSPQLKGFIPCKEGSPSILRQKGKT